MKDIIKEILSLQGDTKPQGGRASGIWRQKRSGTAVKPGPQQEVSVNGQVLLQAGEGTLHTSLLSRNSNNYTPRQGNARLQRLIRPGVGKGS